jgi:acyl-coenzyme A thioesterase PaaI-like protein
VARIRLGRSADGHPGVVHGGILALLIDDVLGFAYPIALARKAAAAAASTGSGASRSDASDATVAVTANLNVNYASPVPSGSSIRVLVYLTEQTDRKLVWRATVVGDDGSEDKSGEEGGSARRLGANSLSASKAVTYCEATSVYVIPRTSSTL